MSKIVSGDNLATTSVRLFILITVVATAASGGLRQPYGRVGTELGDYRLANGEPFVTLYEHENFRGKIFRQRVRRECSNLPFRYLDWSSSVALHGRCVTMCSERNCGGTCVNLYPDGEQGDKGVKRLNNLGINDRGRSVKFCYQQKFQKF